MEEKRKKSPILKEISSWILVLILAFLLSFLIRTFLIERVEVIGSSMVPTLQPGDKIFVNKFLALEGDLKRGDIAVIKTDKEERTLIKRIVALEGDTVSVKDGKLFLNGDPVEENYINEPYIIYTLEETTIDKGCCFVLGDNRNDSKDSHVFGEISISDIKGIYRW